MLKLSDIRIKLDQIDTTIVNLLRNRADLVKQVAESKGKQHLYIKPRREITMMVPLLDQAEDKLHRGYIWKTWRELISHFTLTEGPLSIAVGANMWDLTRDHYGYRTPLSEKNTTEEAVQSVLNGEHKIATISAPEENANDIWWVSLLNSTEHKIFTHLPRLPDSNAKGAKNGGLAIAKLRTNPTGNDISYIIVNGDKEAGQKCLETNLGVSNKVHHIKSHSSQDNGELSLFKVRKYTNDDELSKIELPNTLRQLVWIGGYCVPPSLN